MSNEMTTDTFVNVARAQTMLRDFNKLRDAIRRHDSFAAEDAWDKCERWVDMINPNANTSNEGED